MREECILTRQHLTPEIQLCILNQDCDQYHKPLDKNYNFEAPFWSIYWSGGQGITKFCLQNLASFTNLNILDLGAGCGATSIALYQFGQGLEVTANDIDIDSLFSCRENLVRNLETDHGHRPHENKIFFNTTNYLED